MKYYAVYEDVETKDSRGNLVRTFKEEAKGEVRGRMVTKLNGIITSEGRFIRVKSTTLKMSKNYLKMVKIGYKLGDFIIEDIIEDGRDIVLALEGDKSGN